MRNFARLLTGTLLYRNRIAKQARSCIGACLFLCRQFEIDHTAGNQAKEVEVIITGRRDSCHIIAACKAKHHSYCNVRRLIIMFFTNKQKEFLFPVSTDQGRLNAILSKHNEAKKKLEKDYYDEEKDKQVVKQYYQDIDFNDNQVIPALKKLLKETHSNQVRYEPTEYVYPWVDLNPDGNLKNIYSGENRQAEDVIKEDFKATAKRLTKANQIHAAGQLDLLKVANEFPYNCEHVVPQSWFNEREPMRGDIHHLFTCDPKCNSMRSNYPYHDFGDYNPQSIGIRKIKDACGKADHDLFEPEYGKGIVARAMLYFLIRYPDEIEQDHKETIDMKLLLEWHQQFPVGIYEKHRNQAIYEIQGNRNPFIDFPKEMYEIFKKA